MFVWHKRSEKRSVLNTSGVKFYWWPLLLSLLLSIVITLALNAR